ncbi:MAG: HDIG domain-containing protein [Treponema sp.]|jgi:putative nucleotidyltransferase with HDIG domain|nr:HDIG domain-containing protein [Treponema sp.]
MKKNNEPFVKSLFGKIKWNNKIRVRPSLASLGAFLICTIFVLSGLGVPNNGDAELKEFEVGKVAERDVIADRSISYIDEQATQLRREAEEQLVPAEFKFSPLITDEIQNQYKQLAEFSIQQFEQRNSADAYYLSLQVEYPGAFSRETVNAIYRDPVRENLLEEGAALLNTVLEEGLFAVPESGMEHYNPDTIELLRDYGARAEREQISQRQIVTKKNLPDAVKKYLSANSYSSNFAAIALLVISPFLSENVLFSAGDTDRRLEEVRLHVKPVMKDIARGDRVVRKGFVVSNEDVARLTALNISNSHRQPRNIVGHFFIFAFIYVLLFLLLNPKVIGRKLEEREIYFIVILASAYLIGSMLISSIRLPSDLMPCSVLVPTAMAIMLPALLIGQTAAISIAIVLPLASFAAGAFDFSSYLFAVISGFSAAFILQAAERRMDLIKAGFINAAVNCVAMAAILLYTQNPGPRFISVLFWAAFNGVFSGMLVLGILPLFEQILNSATTFRLIELSDLNNPVLKRLLTVAPGTYSHAVMVANLAESACQEIGANALLARVGAYYHDIGKMDQPDYFVENQVYYNKHTDINPRLSATVIRSHVKIGVEKGRSIGLPPGVVDIIAQHHGNSVISYFYNEAMKKESNVNIEDFTYPGTPPRSREAAVVMLADVVEAAVRTLKKPSAARIEKFVQELIMGKFNMGQLSDSELTFRDLETIKNAFVKVLAGHYHSRIEYPKLKEAANE